MIIIKNLSKKFSKTNALQKLDLTLTEGSFTALVGPSGSGKSTLLHLIAGLTPSTTGEILINNQNLSEMDDSQRSEYRNLHLGLIFQEFHLLPELTVLENILIPSRINKSVNFEKARALLNEVGLSQKIKEKVHSLSGGQKQRVAICRALINSPSIILADEPTGNLDQETGQQIITLLKNLHQKHKTTLLIATHDQEIAKIAENVVYLKDGKLEKHA